MAGAEVGSHQPSSLAPAGDPTSTLTFILASKFTPLKRHAVLLPPHHHEHLEGSFPRRLSQTILGSVTLLKLFKGIICPVCLSPALDRFPSVLVPFLQLSLPEHLFAQSYHSRSQIGQSTPGHINCTSEGRARVWNLLIIDLSQNTDPLLCSRPVLLRPRLSHTVHSTRQHHTTTQHGRQPRTEAHSRRRPCR